MVIGSTSLGRQLWPARQACKSGVHNCDVAAFVYITGRLWCAQLVPALRLRLTLIGSANAARVAHILIADDVNDEIVSAGDGSLCLPRTSDVEALSRVTGVWSLMCFIFEEPECRVCIDTSRLLRPPRIRQLITLLRKSKGIQGRCLKAMIDAGGNNIPDNCDAIF